MSDLQHNLRALSEFADAAKRCRELPYRIPEVWEAYQRQFDAVIDTHIPALVATLTAPASVGEAFERECADVDRILEKLGIGVERGRTEGGSLNVPRILNHIQETLDALALADAAHKHFAAKYADAAHARRVECPEGWAMVPKRVTPEMLAAGKKASARWFYDMEPQSSELYSKGTQHIYEAMLAAAPQAGSQT